MNSISREPAEILLIDSDSLARAAATTVLQGAGHIIHEAMDRDAAVKIAKVRALDLIICDVNLDGESGLDLSRELRRLPGLQDVPVMFVSSSQLPDIIRRSHDAGGAYYLRKPLDPEVLIDLVSKALWLPHLVQSRLSMHEPAAQPVPAPRKRAVASRASAIHGIRIPLA
jgi:CheY-like chemotaxis protein